METQLKILYLEWITKTRKQLKVNEYFNFNLLRNYKNDHQRSLDSSVDLQLGHSPFLNNQLATHLF